MAHDAFVTTASMPLVATASQNQNKVVHLIDAIEKRDVAMIDIPNAFIQMWAKDVKD